MELFGLGVVGIMAVIGISVIVLLWLADRRQSGQSGLTRSGRYVGDMSEDRGTGDGAGDGGGDGGAGSFGGGDGSAGGAGSRSEGGEA